MNSKFNIHVIILTIILSSVAVISVNIYGSMYVLEAYSNIDIDISKTKGTEIHEFATYIKESKNKIGYLEKMIYSIKSPLFWSSSFYALFLVFLPILLISITIVYWRRKREK